MKAIHKRPDGLFPRTVTLVLFLAVCAYGGAGLYARLRPVRPDAAPAAAAEAGVSLSGIVLRSETPLLLPPSAELLAEDGTRIPAGGALARLADGSLLTAPCAGVYRADTDGLEALSPACLETLDDAGLQALLAQAGTPDREVRGRLITDHAWYFVCQAPTEMHLRQGQSCRLRFSEQKTPLRARLIRQSSAVLIFRLTEGGDCLSLRRCEAELIETIGFL